MSQANWTTLDDISLLAVVLVNVICRDSRAKEGNCSSIFLPVDRFPLIGLSGRGSGVWVWPGTHQGSGSQLSIFVDRLEDPG
jgi:hypothetical protein